jgi:hypothetical protein
MRVCNCASPIDACADVVSHSYISGDLGDMESTWFHGMPKRTQLLTFWLYPRLTL